MSPGKSRPAGKAPSQARRLYADRGHDHDTHRRMVRTMAITPHIAHRDTLR
ncbi:hypothetical protein [Streptomyces kebangsaanensis]|uniref:hypothetical protein n=1 Tax=Streptomyces kebangsaanensis TaxID=864058 RepID=UPI000ADA6DE5